MAMSLASLETINRIVCSFQRHTAALWNIVKRRPPCGTSWNAAGAWSTPWLLVGRLRCMDEHCWPQNFEALRRGDGCPMCAPRADETPFGVRVHDGRWADAYLGRYPVRPGYAFVIWKGRHVAEPNELSVEESAGFWREVGLVAAAVDGHYRPVKMNWLSLGNGVPHLHVHLVPRPADDVRAGGPLEPEAFDQTATPPVPDEVLRQEAAALRAALGR